MRYANTRADEKSSALVFYLQERRPEIPVISKEHFDVQSKLNSMM